MNFKQLLICGTLAASTSFAQAQLPIDLASFGAPGGMGLSALPMDAFAGSGLPVNPPIARFADGGIQLIGMGAVLAQNPDRLVRLAEDLAIPVAFTLSPGFEQAVNRPEETPDYYMNGGTILLPDIAVLPRIPVVTEPLMLPGLPQ